MLSKYKKNYEKQVMGYLSYIDDFKNLDNLRDEMKLYSNDDNQFEVLLYKGQDGDCRGIIGIQEGKDFVVIRYLSLDPSYRSAQTQEKVIQELQQEYPHKLISALPDYTYLLKYVNRDLDNE